MNIFILNSIYMYKRIDYIKRNKKTFECNKEI